MSEQYPIGTVVLLNGTSSAGKTSIVYELQKIYGDAYSVAILDDFIRAYEAEHHETIDGSITNDALNKHWDALFTIFYQHINSLLLLGKHVIVDTLEYQDEFEINKKLLVAAPIITILVYCPPHVIVEHVEKRNQSGNIQEQRFVGQAFRQFFEFYKVQESKEEVVIDRISTILIKNALDIAKNDIDLEAQGVPRHIALEKVVNNDQFYLHFMQRFQLHNEHEVALTPTHSWDFIVNAGLDTPATMAQKIATYLTSIKK